MLASVLGKAGIKTGLYISPSVIKVNERICIFKRSRKEEITNAELKRLLKIIDMEENKISKFEFLTAAAFVHFAEKGVEVAVLEGGLGGRLDCVNVINPPLVCAFTSISLDHTKLLGNSPEEIATEKSAIIKKNCPVVVAPFQDEKVISVLKKKCEETNSELIIPALKNNYKTPFLGEHQKINLAVTLKIIDILRKKYKIRKKYIRKGLERAKNIGRFEVIKKDPFVIIDCAHNPAGMEALVCAVKKYFPNIEKVGIFGAMKDKDLDTMLKIAAKIFGKIITVTVDHPSRAESAEKLAEIAKRYVKDIDTAEVIDINKIVVDRDKVYVIFGSVFLIGEVLRKHGSFFGREN